MVLRAGQNVYHDTCFVCTTCKRLLKTGDKYCVIDSKLFCEQDAKAQKQQQILKVKYSKGKTHDKNSTGEIILNVQERFTKQIYARAMQRQITAKPESHPNLRRRDLEQ